jgi:hypothetical protein
VALEDGLPPARGVVPLAADISATLVFASGPPLKLTTYGFVPVASPGPPVTVTLPPPALIVARPFSAVSTSPAVALYGRSDVVAALNVSLNWPDVALTVTV